MLEPPCSGFRSPLTRRFKLGRPLDIVHASPNGFFMSMEFFCQKPDKYAWWTWGTFCGPRKKSRIDCPRGTEGLITALERERTLPPIDVIPPLHEEPMMQSLHFRA